MFGKSRCAKHQTSWIAAEVTRWLAAWVRRWKWQMYRTQLQYRRPTRYGRAILARRSFGIDQTKGLSSTEPSWRKLRTLRFTGRYNKIKIVALNPATVRYAADISCGIIELGFYRTTLAFDEIPPMIEPTSVGWGRKLPDLFPKLSNAHSGDIIRI